LGVIIASRRRGETWVDVIHGVAVEAEGPTSCEFEGIGAGGFVGELLCHLNFVLLIT
jgi:hypothetical protein